MILVCKENIVFNRNSVNIHNSMSTNSAPPHTPSIHISPHSIPSYLPILYPPSHKTSPHSIPRYNSLPTLKGILYDNYCNNSSLDYNLHPKDEEKRLAYTRGESRMPRVIVCNTARDLLRYLMLLFSSKTNNNFPLKTSGKS